MKYLKTYRLFESNEFREERLRALNYISKKILWPRIFLNAPRIFNFYQALASLNRKADTESELIKALKLSGHGLIDKKFIDSLPFGILDEFYAFSRSCQNDYEFSRNEDKEVSLIVSDYLVWDNTNGLNSLKDKVLAACCVFYKEADLPDGWDPEWIDI